jgi:hypothetical protein
MAYKTSHITLVSQAPQGVSQRHKPHMRGGMFSFPLFPKGEGQWQRLTKRGPFKGPSLSLFPRIYSLPPSYTMNSQPPELILKYLSYLDVKDVISCSAVNRAHRQSAQYLLSRRFRESPERLVVHANGTRLQGIILKEVERPGWFRVIFGQPQKVKDVRDLVHDCCDTNVTSPAKLSMTPHISG